MSRRNAMTSCGRLHRDRSAPCPAVTSNRGSDEWLAAFADPIRAQRAIDCFTSNAYDLVIEGESDRPRLKLQLVNADKERTR